MVRLTAFIIFFSFTGSWAQKPPDQVYGKLFYDVQMSRIFPDSKTFVDCIPKRAPGIIVSEYLSSGLSEKDSQMLKEFVAVNFSVPSETNFAFTTSETNLETHIHQLWKFLKREKDSIINGSSLLGLPYPYIVPGGRFREIYYWDSYFTMLGLKESGETELMENMVRNFAWLLKKYRIIPNGNRTYYLTRSQPPFFSMMVALLAEAKNEQILKTYRADLKREMKYWKKNHSFKINGQEFFRYGDKVSIPRQESFIEDVVSTGEALNYALEKNPFMNRDSFTTRNFQHLRAAAASGWDFSTRWFRDEKQIRTIRTTDIIPVDLNCLLFNLESMSGKKKKESAGEREKKIRQFKALFFNHELGWYCDYNIHDQQPGNIPTLAGMFPLFLKLADEKEVPAIVDFLEKNFLKPGGVVTSLNTSGEQWDAPNGWAPLQWITIVGLENYGYHELAKEIAIRWYRLNKKVFEQTGKLMEKYNVVDTDVPAGGGEYPSQDGFGWTNGVLLALIKKYDLK